MHDSMTPPPQDDTPRADLDELDFSEDMDSALDARSPMWMVPMTDEEYAQMPAAERAVIEEAQRIHAKTPYPSGTETDR